MAQLIISVLIISVVVYIFGIVMILLDIVLNAIFVSSIATIGSVIIIGSGSYLLRRSIINRVFLMYGNSLGKNNYTIGVINKEKKKINLYVFIALLYALYIMLEGRYFYNPFISGLKYDLLNKILIDIDVSYDIFWIGGFVVWVVVIYIFTRFINKKFTNWTVNGIEKRIKKNPHITLRTKPKITPKPIPAKKINVKIDPIQYGISSSMSKQDIKKILNIEFQKWHNASRSPNTDIVSKARIHKTNIAILRTRLLNNGS